MNDIQEIEVKLETKIHSSPIRVIEWKYIVAELRKHESENHHGSSSSIGAYMFMQIV